MTREEAIGIILNDVDTHTIREGIALNMAIKALEQEPRKGHWIFVHPLQENDGGAYMCSNCETGDWSYQIDYNFCPNCGADMREVEK